MVDNTFVPGIHSDIISRFPGVEIVYYGVARPGGPQPNGPEVVLTAAQFRALNSTPQTIIPAIAGKTILPVRIHMRKESGAGFVAGSNTGVQFRYAASGLNIGNNVSLANLRFDQTTEESHMWVTPSSSGFLATLGIGTHISSQTGNTAVQLFGTTADMSSGGSPVHISVLAELWPVSLS